MRTPLFFLFCLLAPLLARAELNVVTTLPDFAAIAQEIGGDKIKVTSLARGTEDPHFVEAKPSFIRVLNKADVLIEGGAELEIGWLPPLVENARNRKILPGGAGRVNAAEGIELLDVHSGPIDRSQGDVHAAGNPHYLLDPANGKIIAANIAARLSRLDPPNAAHYQANLRQFTAKLDRKLAEWSERMAPLRGAKMVTYHKNFDYFARRFGLEVAGNIEPKPGLEPSPRHIADLVPRMKAAEVKLVIIEPNRGQRTPEHLSQAIGAQLLILPIMVEGHPKAADYLSLFDYLVDQITGAMKAAR